MAALLLCLTQACSSSQPPAAASSTQSITWQSPRYQSHELVGKIWLGRENRFIDQATLNGYLAEQPVLLLGEKHDNPDHHRLRLELLTALLDDTPRLLVMEMMAPEQQQALATLTPGAGPQADPSALPTLLNWDTEGWPWQYYGPVVQLALRTQTTLLAGNISADNVMQIYRDESASALENPLRPAQIDQLYRDIDSSHCGMLPESQFPAMVRIQQARDQQMADALMAQIDTVEQRVLLAGNYHIRKDLSVPNYLPDDVAAVSVAFLEVDPMQETPEAYLQGFSGQAAYDVIWFTPAVDAGDYCAGMTATNGSSSRSDN